MGTKVSVIIPVYNAETYIGRCIESLLCQTLQACEFIFINDGSKDNSREVIETYKETDDRVILVNQENQGVSIARNTGLELARGEYIGFVDADDYVEKDLYETLYRSAKQDDCDVVISNYETELDGHKSITSYTFPTNCVLNKDYIQQQILPYFIEKENLNAVWNKIYKKTLLVEHQATFPEKVPFGEDEHFNIRVFGSAGSVKFLDYAGYHYQEVTGSASRNLLEGDYFNKFLEIYTSELPDQYIKVIGREKAHQLKSIRFIHNVMSLIHVYFRPSKDMSLNSRYRFVKKMIENEYVRDALPAYYKEIYGHSGRYDKFIADMIYRRSAFGLLCATAYSRFRSK